MDLDLSTGMFHMDSLPSRKQEKLGGAWWPPDLEPADGSPVVPPQSPVCDCPKSSRPSRQPFSSSSFVQEKIQLLVQAQARVIDWIKAPRSWPLKPFDRRANYAPFLFPASCLFVQYYSYPQTAPGPPEVESHEVSFEVSFKDEYPLPHHFHVFDVETHVCFDPASQAICS